MKALFAIIKRSASLCYWAVALVAIAFAALMLSLRYWLLPGIDGYRDRVAQAVSQATGMQASIEHIEGGWYGLRPRLALSGFTIADKRGKTVFRFDQAEVYVSWWTFARGEPMLSRVVLIKPNLDLRRDTQGIIYLGDQPLNQRDPNQPDDPAMMEWLLKQPGIEVREGTLAWTDEYVKAPRLELERLNVLVDKDGRDHRFALDALPKTPIASRIAAKGDVRFVVVEKILKATGNGFVEAQDASVQTIKRHLPFALTENEADLLAGRGNVRAWVDIASTGLRELTADVAARDLTLKLGHDLKALPIASLAGRFVYRDQPERFQLESRGLQVAFPQTNAAQPSDFSITIGKDTQKQGVARGELAGSYVDLGLVSALVDYFPLDKELKAKFARFAPVGVLADTKFKWIVPKQGPMSFDLDTRISNFGLAQVDKLPGTNGLNARVKGTEKGGEFVLDESALTLDIPHIFQAPLKFAKAAGKATWSRDPQKPAELNVAIERIALNNADVSLEAKGAYRTLPDSKQNSPGWVDLTGTLKDVQANRVFAYLPNGVDKARSWVERAIAGGKVKSGTFALKGDLWHFPFGDGKNGAFSVNAELEDANLKYLPEWPEIAGISGELKFTNARIEVIPRKARIFDSPLVNTRAQIASLETRPVVVEVNGTVDTTAKDAYRFLRESPLASGPGRLMQAVDIEGPGKLKLDLNIPLDGPDPVKVKGDYEFTANTVSAGRDLRLREAKGTVRFTETGVSGKDITGVMFNQPAKVEIVTPTEGTIVTTLAGRIDAKDLRALFTPVIVSQLSGVTDWKARIASKGGSSELIIDSQLTGVSSELPVPLAKKADEALALSVIFRELNSPRESITVNLGDRLEGRFYRSFEGNDNGRVKSAIVSFGTLPAAAKAAPPPGLWLSGSIPFVDYDRWRSITQQVLADGAIAQSTAAAPAADAGGLDLKGIDLAMGRIRFFGRDYQAMTAKLTNDKGVWKGRVSSPDVEGDVQWDGNGAGGKGALTAKLTRFNLLAEQAVATATAPVAESTPTAAAQSIDLPQLDIVADSFKFRGQWLGKMELKAAPRGEEWRIDKVAFETEHGNLQGTGGARRTGNGPITTLNLTTESGNLNAVFNQFGYGEVMRRGTGKLTGQLSWPGPPQDFAINALFGEFQVEWKNGQFAKLEPGVGKLIGLLSLQSIPRRFSFDFRDVFSEGFAFDRIAGGVKVSRGVLLTENFEISGPAAFVTLSGDVSLPNETQNLKLRVVPEVGESIALAAAVFGTPVLGLTTLLVQKLLQNPLNKIVAYEYQVTGTWDNPTMARTSGLPGIPGKAAQTTSP